MTEQQLIELEVRISYQDLLIAELDEVVRTFAKRVEVLEREVALLRASVVALPEQVGGADEPPPHY